MTINLNAFVIQYFPKGGTVLQTLYIDVYFLINLTIDFLALYFACIFSKVPTSGRRLLFGATLGGGISVIGVLLPEIFLVKLAVAFFGLPIIVIAATKKVSVKRRIKASFAFLIFGALFGAGFYFMYGLVDKFLYKYLDESDGGIENPKLVLFSLIVLVLIGVFKMLISFFNNIESEGSRMLEITLSDKKIRAEAFVDSGNLAIDPMDMRPILFIKSDFAGCFLPKSVIDLEDPDKLDREMRKRIRLIPISTSAGTKVLTGIKPDSVRVINKEGKNEEISVTLAIDKESGTYGGFFALLPSVAVSGVR